MCGCRFNCYYCCCCGYCSSEWFEPQEYHFWIAPWSWKTSTYKYTGPYNPKDLWSNKGPVSLLDLYSEAHDSLFTIGSRHSKTLHHHQIPYFRQWDGYMFYWIDDLPMSGSSDWIWSKIAKCFICFDWCCNYRNERSIIRSGMDDVGFRITKAIKRGHRIDPLEARAQLLMF